MGKGNRSGNGIRLTSFIQITARQKP